MGGRLPALTDLGGDGVPVLRRRLTAQPSRGPVERFKAPVRVLLSDRRSRDAVTPSR